MRLPRARRRAGFTLAEVAVTIVIVGIALVLVLQGLNTAKITAAQTRNLKLARELGLFTLGQVESGLLRDDIDTGMQGSYAEEGYPEFAWELALGDDSFPDAPDRSSASDKPYDSWAPTQAELDDKAKQDEEDAEEPFEKVKIRVTFPRIREFANDLVLERWMPWAQVYGEADTGDGKGSTNRKASKGGASGGGAAPGVAATGTGTKP